MKKIFTRTTIREYLKAMSMTGVDFIINNKGEYFVKVGDEYINTIDARTTYTTLTALELGYQSGKKHLPEKQVNELLRQEMENKPEKCSEYFMHLCIKNLFDKQDKETWVKEILEDLGRGSLRYEKNKWLANKLANKYSKQILEYEESRKTNVVRF